MRGEPLEKIVVILDETGFIIVDVHACGDVHGIDETESLSDSTFFQGRVHLGSDVDIGPPRFGLEPQFLSIRFHEASSLT
jgi:hypothetical protein